HRCDAAEREISGLHRDREADVAAEQVERAVREIDDAQQPEDQGKPAGDDEQQRRERDAVEQLERVHVGALFPATEKGREYEQARATMAFLAPCGGGMGRGVAEAEVAILNTPLPFRALCARNDLPHKGRGAPSQIRDARCILLTAALGPRRETSRESARRSRTIRSACCGSSRTPCGNGGSGAARP